MFVISFAQHFIHPPKSWFSWITCATRHILPPREWGVTSGWYLFPTHCVCGLFECPIYGYPSVLEDVFARVMPIFWFCICFIRVDPNLHPYFVPVTVSQKAPEQLNVHLNAHLHSIDPNVNDLRLQKCKSVASFCLVNNWFSHFMYLRPPKSITLESCFHQGLSYCGILVYKACFPEQGTNRLVKAQLLFASALHVIKWNIKKRITNHFWIFDDGGKPDAGRKVSEIVHQTLQKKWWIMTQKYSQFPPICNSTSVSLWYLVPASLASCSVRWLQPWPHYSWFHIIVLHFNTKNCKLHLRLTWRCAYVCDCASIFPILHFSKWIWAQIACKKSLSRFLWLVHPHCFSFAHHVPYWFSVSPI